MVDNCRDWWQRIPTFPAKALRQRNKRVFNEGLFLETLEFYAISHDSYLPLNFLPNFLSSLESCPSKWCKTGKICSQIRTKILILRRCNMTLSTITWSERVVGHNIDQHFLSWKQEWLCRPINFQGISKLWSEQAKGHVFSVGSSSVIRRCDWK